jgi:glutathione S-transferase
MITLYGAARVPYTEKVRRALLYKRVPFEFHEPTSPADYQRWNPKSGMLPVLQIGDELIEDSTQIVYALDARFPDPPLLAVDPTVASQQRQLEDWADESFLWHWMRYRRMLGGEEAPLPLAGEGAVAPNPLLKSSSFRRLRAWLKAGGTWERPITGLQRELGARMDDLVNFLGSRPFFYSDRLSIADLGVYAMMFTMRRDSIPGSARLLAERPGLVAFMARVEAATDASGDG